jgi:hypothetical protein
MVLVELLMTGTVAGWPAAQYTFEGPESIWEDQLLSLVVEDSSPAARNGCRQSVELSEEAPMPVGAVN